MDAEESEKEVRIVRLLVQNIGKVSLCDYSNIGFFSQTP